MQHNFGTPNKPMNSESFRNATGWDLYIRENELIISGECTKAQAKAALDAHNPPDPKFAADTRAALKASAIAKLVAGNPLTADEAKLLIG